MGKKKAGRKENPKAREIVAGGNPDAFFDKTPSWAFRQGDAERWTIKKCSSNDFETIIDQLSNFESMTWKEILSNKKMNHPIDVNSLNPIAIKRLTELRIEVESIYSIRIEAKKRIYGFIQGDGTFQIVWYDPDHGDNQTCVCRSNKKHT